jgi:hypothetical protein
MDREDVYGLIDDERTFQETKWRHRPTLPVADELLIMRAYINKAMNSYVGVVGEKVALDQVRKVVATGVRCLENHGDVEKVRR